MVKSKLTVAKYLDQQISLSEKSQKEIAEACGWERPNMVTMVKQGVSKLPINKVGPLAKVLNVDPVYLFRLVMSEYMPETWSALEEILGQQKLVSEQDLALLKAIHKATKNAPIDLDDPRVAKMFEESFEKFIDRVLADRESAVKGARAAAR